MCTHNMATQLLISLSLSDILRLFKLLQSCLKSRWIRVKLAASRFSPVTTTVLLPGGLGIYQQFRPRRGSLDRNIPSFQTAVPGSQPDSCLVFSSVHWLNQHRLNPQQWNKVLFIYFIWTYLFHLGFMPFWFHETGGPGMHKCNPLTIILLFVPHC